MKIRIPVSHRKIEKKDRITPLVNHNRTLLPISHGKRRKTKAEKRRIRKRKELSRGCSDNRQTSMYTPRLMVYNLPQWSG